MIYLYIAFAIPWIAVMPFNLLLLLGVSLPIVLLVSLVFMVPLLIVGIVESRENV